MGNPETREKTAGGPVGKLAGKAKELARVAFRNDQLAREGPLQQAQAEADAAREAAEAEQRDVEVELRAARVDKEMEHMRLQTELSAVERQAGIGRDRERGQRQVESHTQQEKLGAEAEGRARQAAAMRLVKQAEAVYASEKRAAAQLEKEARRAEARADDIDPKEK